MMHALPCAAVQDRLEAFHDGELSLDEQVAIQNHLGECVACALVAAELDDLSGGLREAAALRQPRIAIDALGLSSQVLERIRVEEALSFTSQVRGLFQDMHLVWAGLCATLATVICLIGSASVLHAASQEHPDSLAGVIAFLASSGSNDNPRRLDADMMAPRAVTGADIEMSEEDAAFALAAVVTREGRVRNIEVIAAEQARHLRVRPEVVLAMLDEASRVRFEPAQARWGNPVAVSMVWVLANTTVKGRFDDDSIGEPRKHRGRVPEPAGLPGPASAVPDPAAPVGPPLPPAVEAC